MYSHVQTGRLMILSAAGVACVALAAYFLTPRGVGAYPAAAVAAFLYFGFRELLVEVDHEAVRISFGIGWFRKSFPLSGIESAAVVRTSWLNGWGIKYFGRGWLYNVDGFDAVELRLSGGRLARIGTDEPAALETAIRESLTALKGRKI